MTQMKTSSDEMKVAIIANGKPQSRRVASKLFNAFRDDPDFYLTKKNPDVVISIGGDGMLLSAFHMYEKELARVCVFRDSHGSFRLFIRIIWTVKWIN